MIKNWLKYRLEFSKTGLRKVLDFEKMVKNLTKIKCLIISFAVELILASVHMGKAH